LEASHPVQRVCGLILEHSFYVDNEARDEHHDEHGKYDCDRAHRSTRAAQGGPLQGRAPRGVRVPDGEGGGHRAHLDLIVAGLAEVVGVVGAERGGPGGEDLHVPQAEGLAHDLAALHVLLDHLLQVVALVLRRGI